MTITPENPPDTVCIVRRAVARRPCLFLPFALLVLLLCCCPAALAEPPSGIPVLLDDVPVLTVHAGGFTFTPEERAKAISVRIASVAHTPRLAVERIEISHGESESVIKLDDIMLMTVTDDDAAAAKVPREDLARGNAEKIKQTIADYRERRSTRILMMGAGKAAAVTLVLVFLLFLLKRFFPRLEKRVTSWKGTVIRTIRFQSMEILNERRAVGLLLSLLRLARNVLVLLLLYIYIPLVLSFFPWTEGVAERLFGYVIAPVIKIWLAMSANLPNLFFVLVIAVCTRYFIRFCRFLFAEVERRKITLPGFYPDWAMPTFRIIRFLIIIFAVVMAFPYLPGSDSLAFRGVTVFLGVLLSLGSSSAVANAVAGTIIIYMRAFHVGDHVRIGDTAGDVIEKNLLLIRVRTPQNVDITIPNAVVLGSHITNYSSSKELILHTDVTIGYDVPWQRVHALLIDAAGRTEGILPDPPPFVRQKALNDTSVAYEINAYTNAPSRMGATYSDLHRNIQDCFQEAGVEIMSPGVLALRDGSAVAIPSDFLPSALRVRAEQE